VLAPGKRDDVAAGVLEAVGRIDGAARSATIEGPHARASTTISLFSPSYQSPVVAMWPDAAFLFCYTFARVQCSPVVAYWRRALAHGLITNFFLKQLSTVII
jgi:hypothetical protein